jgi:hypothetical protein
MPKRSTAVELEYLDISMILVHLHQSSRDGWYYGNRTHFCNRRDRLIEALEKKTAPRAPSMTIPTVDPVL